MLYENQGMHDMPNLPNKLRHRDVPWSAIQSIQLHGFVILRQYKIIISISGMWLCHEGKQVRLQVQIRKKQHHYTSQNYLWNVIVS